MKTLLLLVSTSLTLAACGSGPAHGRSTDFDAFAARHDRAWNRHDPVALADLFTEDGTLVTPAGVRVEGRAALLEVLAQPGPTRATTSRTRFESVQWLADDLVVLDGVQTLEGPGVERLGATRAHIVAVARREGDGWRLVASRPSVQAQ